MNKVLIKPAKNWCTETARKLQFIAHKGRRVRRSNNKNQELELSLSWEKLHSNQNLQAFKCACQCSRHWHVQRSDLGDFRPLLVSMHDQAKHDMVLLSWAILYIQQRSSNVAEWSESAVSDTAIIWKIANRECRLYYWTANNSLWPRPTYSPCHRPVTTRYRIFSIYFPQDNNTRSVLSKSDCTFSSR